MKEIGQPVFERQSRQLALTVTGKLLQARAQQIVAMIDDTEAEPTDDGQHRVILSATRVSTGGGRTDEPIGHGPGTRLAQSWRFDGPGHGTSSGQ